MSGYEIYRGTEGDELLLASTGAGVTNYIDRGELTSEIIMTPATNTTGGIKCVTVRSIDYRPLAEIYVAFSAIFSPGVASSYQRIGLYNNADGFYLGYEGSVFGVTIRKNSSNTFIPQASFNADLLDGGSESVFTRAGVPEALTTTNENLYRIRFGWLGASPIEFELLSPDGDWVAFHRILHPNLSPSTSINTPNLPITLDVQKTSAGATNLAVSTACWAAGTASELTRLNFSISDTTLAKLTRSVIAAKQPGGNYTNIQATTGGNLKVSVEEIEPSVIVPTSQYGTWTVRAQDGYGNPLLAKTTTAQASDPGLVVRVVESNSHSTIVHMDGYVENIYNRLTPASSSITRVPASATAVTLLNANLNRKGATVFNESNRTLYLALGAATASATNYTIQIIGGGYYEVPFGFAGRLSGFWTAASGAALVGEVV
jgi:hypothetical protein